MVIIVHGDDTFRAQEKVKELRAAFARKFDPTGLNFASFGPEARPGEVLQAAGALPFMAQRRMVVARDIIASTKKDGEAAWAALASAPESAIVVLWETENVEKKPLYAALRKGADVRAYPFPELAGAALQKWAEERTADRGGKIVADAARELCERVGPDLWQMDNEIRKLVAYAARDGARGTIAKADVEEMVRATFEGEIFALVDAVSRKEGAKAVRLLREERASGASDFSIFGMLARQTRILLGARALLDEDPRAPSAQLASDMGLHPFVAQKALDQARKFTLADLRATHDLLFKYDAGMKSGYLAADLAVDLVAAALIR
jgi:DNA polymerase-3 subunit delta